MGKANTTTVEIKGFSIAIPAGPMSEPTAIAKVVYGEIVNPKNWKLATTTFQAETKKTADEVAYCLDFYLGGHEMEEVVIGGKTVFKVSSKGYYHYIGS